MDLLVRNVRIASLEPNGNPYGRIDADALAFREGRIAWIGAHGEAPAAPIVIDGECGWVTPALIDCHTHLVHGGNRAREFEMRLAGVSYEEIARSGGGINATVDATRAAPEEELLAQALPRARRLAQEGVTVLEVKSGYGLDTANEMKMLRVARRLGEMLPLTVRATLLALHAVPPEYRGRTDAYVDYACAELIPEVARANLADAVDGFCEHIGFTLEQVERAFTVAREHGLPVKLHAEQLSNQRGAALAARFGALSADHLEYIDEEGVKAMAGAGTVAVLLPGAFFYLRERQLPPIHWLRAHRVPMAIATDNNPGTSPYASLLLMLNMACTAFRMTPEEALAGVTREAARALGMQDSHGTLAMGKAADVLLWEIDHPAELAYSYGTHVPRRVFRAGVEVAAA
ncbi:MAG TPA: imidazolonepropionase [Usitatibacter sp.]|nr:imidazolonepropionase [Usitatibacter sp.]